MEFDLNDMGKRTPFRTPEGFFERMQAETLKRAAEEKRKQKLRRLKWGVSVALAVAAMFCGFLFFPTVQPEPTEQPSSVEWLAQANEDTYWQNLTDEEMEAWMDFNESDIFYELTTENFNEDEN